MTVIAGGYDYTVVVIMIVISNHSSIMSVVCYFSSMDGTREWLSAQDHSHWGEIYDTSFFFFVVIFQEQTGFMSLVAGCTGRFGGYTYEFDEVTPLERGMGHLTAL